MPPTNPNEDKNPFSPKRKWKKHKQNAGSKGESPDNSCPICLGSLQDQDIATPECCDHSFCLICIKEWASKVKTCPVDRLPFSLLLVRKGNQASISTVLTVRAPGVFEPLGGGRGEQSAVVECTGCHLRVPKCYPFPLRLVAGRWYCHDCHLNLMDLDSVLDPLFSLVPPLEATTTTAVYDVIPPEPVKSVLLVQPTPSLQLLATGSVDHEISSFETSRSQDVLGSILQSQLQLHRSSGWGARQCPQSPGSSSSGSPPRPSSPQSTSRPASPIFFVSNTSCCEPTPDPTASFLLDASLSLSIKSPAKKTPISDDDVDIYSDIESLHENDSDRESAAPLQPLASHGGDSGEDSSENELVIDLQATSAVTEDCAITSSTPVDSPASSVPPVEQQQQQQEMLKAPSPPQDISENSMDESTLYKPPPSSDNAKMNSLPQQTAPSSELYDPFNIEDSTSSSAISNPLLEKDVLSSLMDDLTTWVEQQLFVPLPGGEEEEIPKEETSLEEPSCKKIKLDLVEEEENEGHLDPPTPELKDPEPDFILEKELLTPEDDQGPNEVAPVAAEFSSSNIKLPDTEDISDTEDEPFPPDSVMEEDDREEGEIIEVEEVQKPPPPTKRKKPCKKHHKSCRKERSPSAKSGESGEIRDPNLFKTKGYEKFSMILGDQYDQNVNWKRLSKNSKDRSYRDGKPKDEEVLFKVRELKRKRKSIIVSEESKKKKDPCDHHKNKKNDKGRKRDRSLSRERSRSHGRKRSRSKSRSRSRSRHVRGSSQNRNKDHIRSRNHHSRNRSRSRNNSRARSRSPYNRNNSRARSRSPYNRNNSRARSRSPYKPRGRSRSRNRHRRSRSRKRSIGRSRSRNRSHGRSRSRNRNSRSFGKSRSPLRNSSRYHSSNRRSRHSKSPEKSRSRNRSYTRYSRSRSRHDDKRNNRKDKYSTSRSSSPERSRSLDKNKAKPQPAKIKEKVKAKAAKKASLNPILKSQVVSEDNGKPKSVANTVKAVGKKKKSSTIAASEQDQNGDSAAVRPGEVHKVTKKKHDKHHGEKKGKVKKKKKHVCEHARKKERNISTVDSSLKIELEKHEPCSKSEIYADTLISKLEQQNSKPNVENILGNSLESKEIYTKGDSIIINLNFNNSNKEELLEKKSNQGSPAETSSDMIPGGTRDQSEEKESTATLAPPPTAGDMYWQDAPSPAESFKNGGEDMEEEKEESSDNKELASGDTDSPMVEKVSPASSPSSTGGDSYDPCQPTMSPPCPDETEGGQAPPAPPSALSLLPNALVYLAQLKPGLLPTPPKFIGGPPLQAVLPAFAPTTVPPLLEKRKASVAPLKRAKLEDFDKLTHHDGPPADSKAMPDLSDPSSSEKFLLKLNRQERVIEEVKMVLKPFYNKRDIDKDDYKEILRKSVPKICHNKSRDINPIKIKHLVEGYVKKYKYLRKKLRKNPIEY